MLPRLEFHFAYNSVVTIAEHHRLNHLSLYKMADISQTIILETFLWMQMGFFIIPPAQQSCLGGYIGFISSVCLSVCPSVRLSRILCPLCGTYSPSWIHFIFIHLIKQPQKVCHLSSLLQNVKIWIFGSFFLNFNFDFVLFWLGIWCESLVWVIMGQRGVSQNAGVLVVVVKISFNFVFKGPIDNTQHWFR